MAGPMTPVKDGLKSPQRPDTLHVDLPPADPHDVILNISKFLLQITTE